MTKTVKEPKDEGCYNIVREGNYLSYIWCRALNMDVLIRMLKSKVMHGESQANLVEALHFLPILAMQNNKTWKSQLKPKPPPSLLSHWIELPWHFLVEAIGQPLFTSAPSIIYKESSIKVAP